MCQRAPKVSYSRASSPIEHFDTETFELSRDPAFVNKVRDVHGLYPNLADRALMLCVDEKSQIQAVEGTAPVLPMRTGQVERRSHDYTQTSPAAILTAHDTSSFLSFACLLIIRAQT
jgi:hypothetical protein